MKTSLWAGALLIAASAVPAQGEGAIAVGIPDGGPKNGYAYTLHVRNNNADDAERRALEGCRAQAEKYGVPPSRCKVVASFSGKCVSVAFDTNERSAGWAVADNEKAAAADAIKKCTESGARSCQTHNTDCDR